MTSSILDSNDAAFDDDVLRHTGVVLVDFWAAWCAPCKALSPILEKVAQSYVGKARVVKVNADDNRQTAERFRVRGLPTMLFFKDGKEVQRLVGTTTQTRIGALLDQHLGSSVVPPVTAGGEVRAMPPWFDYAVEVLSSVMPDDAASKWQVRWQQTGLAANGDTTISTTASRLIGPLLQEFRPTLEALPSAARLLAALSEVQCLHSQAAVGNSASSEIWQAARTEAAKAADAVIAAEHSDRLDLKEIAASVQAAAWDPVASPPCLGEVLDSWRAWRDSTFDQTSGWSADNHTEVQEMLEKMQVEHIANKPDESRDVFALLREHHPEVEARLMDYIQRQQQWQAASIEQAAERLAGVFAVR